MKGLKLVVIGAGSSYTPELMEGILKRQNEFPIRELWLVDIEDGREKMAIIAGLTRRMLEKNGLDIPVYETLDRTEALLGADFQGRLPGRTDQRRKDIAEIRHDRSGDQWSGWICQCMPHYPDCIGYSERNGTTVPGCLVAELHQPVGNGH